MKLREKFRRFWTMDVHNHEGFTLVELIIVIAILAILSGVAVVGYSSYVEKANMSADKALVAEIVNVLTIANYDKPLNGMVTIVLKDKDEVQIVTNDDDMADAWVRSALQDAYGSGYESLLKIKHSGWGNGVAVTKVMLDALEKYDMSNLYETPDSLSFTEEMPVLMEEIKNLSMEIGKTEEGAIQTVMMASIITSKWSVADIQNLWNTPIPYSPSDEKDQFPYDVDSVVNGTEDWNKATEGDKRLTIAGLLRAKNTCLALYAKNNMKLAHPTGVDLYAALSSFSVKGKNTPMDLTRVPNGAAETQRLLEVLQLDTGIESHREYLGELQTLLGNYKTAEDANGNSVAANDAAAYAAMMGIVNEVTTSDESPVSGTDLDEYFNAASGAVTMFQQLIMGTLKIQALKDSMAQIAATGANVSITLIPNGADLKVIVGPTTVLG